MKKLIAIGLVLLAGVAYAYDKCEVEEVADIIEVIDTDKAEDIKDDKIIGKRLTLLCKKTKLTKGDKVKVKVEKKIEGC